MPSPATTKTLPGTRTPNPPNPAPDRYAVPMTLLLLSRRTTAPSRTPGAAGVNVTDSVQVASRASVAFSQFNAPAPLAKSRPVTPSVSTSTLATAPAARAVTVTFCPPLTAPTGCEPNWDCACAPVYASRTAAEISVQLRMIPLADRARAADASFAELWPRLLRFVPSWASSAGKGTEPSFALPSSSTLAT